MKKRKLPKDATQAEFYNWVLTAGENEFLNSLNDIDYKKKLGMSIESEPKEWQDFGKNYSYPFEDNIQKSLILLGRKSDFKKIDRFITNEDAEKLMSFKGNYDESKEWKKFGLDFSPYSINHPIKEILADIDFWSKDKPHIDQLFKLRDLLKNNFSVVNLILNGFIGMNNKLTSMRYNVIDDLIQEKRKRVRLLKNKNRKLEILREITVLEKQRKTEILLSNEKLTQRNENLEKQLGLYKKYFTPFKAFYDDNRSLGKAEMIYQEFQKQNPVLANYPFSKFKKNFYSQGYTLRKV